MKHHDTMNFGICMLVTALVLLGISPVFAVDGVIEVNQAKALAGGVTSSDTAGFPVTIGSSGSYRLSMGSNIPLFCASSE